MSNFAYLICQAVFSVMLKVVFYVICKMLKVVFYVICKMPKMAMASIRASIVIIGPGIVAVVFVIIICVLAALLLYSALVNVMQFVTKNFIDIVILLSVVLVLIMCLRGVIKR